MPGLMFVVQAPEASVAQIHRSSLAFIEGQFSRLNLIGNSQLGVYKQALAANLSQPPKSLSEQSQYFSRSLFYQPADQALTFQRKQLLLDAVEAVDAEQWKLFIAKLKQHQYSNMLLVSTLDQSDAGQLAPFKAVRKAPINKQYISYP